MVCSVNRGGFVNHLILRSHRFNKKNAFPSQLGHSRLSPCQFQG